ncbi:hypothetical protein T439DRAFT_187143 [Meredithblackwellia eburnea MCA 4105]
MKKVLYWFRTDLRLHDSPALQAALDLNPVELYPTWCWDPHYVYNARVGANRWQFLTDSMRDVSENLTKLNSKQQLFVVRGPPSTVLPALWKEWGITDIVWEKDDDPYTAGRDAHITKLAQDAKVKVHVVLGHTLFDSSTIISKGNGCPRSYGPFAKLIESLPPPPKPLPPPTSLPGPGNTSFSWQRSDHSVEAYRSKDVNNSSRETGTTERDHSYSSFAGPAGDFAVPTMDELGMVATSTIRGGETRALEVFERFMEDERRVSNFKKPETSPAAWEPADTTILSPHMKFGTLSCRKFYHRVREINSKHKTHSKPPESLIGQLFWREFFHANQADTPNFGQIRGNPTSRFIPWRLQTQYDAKGEEIDRKQMEALWKKDDAQAWEHFSAWKEGRTGFPWIDALMRQLKQHGWMHHLGRHSVACFLTRGQLYISWERGAEVFDEFLVDWDPALNSGNWMWLSASAFFSQYFRVYSPVTYGQNTDKSGSLIRKFVPELAKFPDKWIYEPWKAPIVDQKKFGCVIGRDYPKKIVDEKAFKETALRNMKAAYDAKLQGDDPKVLNGTAEDFVNSFLPKPKSNGKRQGSASASDNRKTKQAKLEF